MSVMIVCDGCGTTYGEPEQYNLARDARRGALDAGWKLVAKKLPNGRSARVDQTNHKGLGNITRTANDVCPKCIDAFEPENFKGASVGRKSWWTERIEELQAENARLRAGGWSP